MTLEAMFYLFWCENRLWLRNYWSYFVAVLHGVGWLYDSNTGESMISLEKGWQRTVCVHVGFDFGCSVYDVAISWW